MQFLVKFLLFLSIIKRNNLCKMIKRREEKTIVLLLHAHLTILFTHAKNIFNHIKLYEACNKHTCIHIHFSIVALISNIITYCVSLMQ